MNRVWTLAVTATAWLALSQMASADIQAAMATYQSHDFDKAFKQFQELAEIGNPQAQYALGVMYLRGEGASSNQLLGYGWLKLASENGHAKATELLPKIRADMVDESVGAAERLVSRFAPSALNDRLMPKILHDCEYSGVTAPKPNKSAMPLDWPEDAAGMAGSVFVELTIAADGTVRDTRVVRAFPIGVFEDAVLRSTPRWSFQPALKDGQPIQSVLNVAAVFASRAGSMPLAEQKWFTEIKAKAEAGDPTSQYVYAMILSGDPTVHQRWGNVLPWIEKSAQAGYAPAQYQLGESLLTGRGCEADPGKAIEWLKLAAQADDADAQTSLARVLLKAGPAFDPQKALFWLSRASDLKSPRANKYLAAILAASPDEHTRDPARAMVLVGNIERGDAREPTSIEIRAAALANQGEYASAIKSQSAAIKRAAQLHWDTSQMQARLQTYENKQPWYGELIPF
jgi:TonB family protein